MHHFVSHDGQRHMSRQDSLDLLERILKAKSMPRMSVFVPTCRFLSCAVVTLVLWRRWGVGWQRGVTRGPLQVRLVAPRGSVHLPDLNAVLFLQAACAESEVYSLRWQPNDFAVWANRRLIHTTTPAKHYDGVYRVLGAAPVGDIRFQAVAAQV